MTRVTSRPILLGVSRFRLYEPIKYYKITTTGKHVRCEQRVAYLQTTLIDRVKDRKDRQKDYHQTSKKDRRGPRGLLPPNSPVPKEPPGKVCQNTLTQIQKKPKNPKKQNAGGVQVDTSPVSQGYG